jgi:hypothetical protein
VVRPRAVTAGLVGSPVAAVVCPRCATRSIGKERAPSECGCDPGTLVRGPWMAQRFGPAWSARRVGAHLIEHARTGCTVRPVTSGSPYTNLAGLEHVYLEDGWVLTFEPCATEVRFFVEAQLVRDVADHACLDPRSAWMRWTALSAPVRRCSERAVRSLLAHVVGAPQASLMTRRRTLSSAGFVAM